MQIGILGMLGLIFLTLKLVGVIAWSWWLVLLPFYLGFVVLGMIGIVVMFGFLFSKNTR